MSKQIPPLTLTENKQHIFDILNANHKQIGLPIFNFDQSIVKLIYRLCKLIQVTKVTVMSASRERTTDVTTPGYVITVTFSK